MRVIHLLVIVKHIPGVNFTIMLRKLYLPIFLVLLSAAYLSAPAFADDAPMPAEEPAAQTAPADDSAAPPAVPSDPEPEVKHKCIVTEMPWEDSPTRVEAIFNVDGELLRGYFVNLAYMYMLRDTMVADGKLVEIAQVKMLDYPTFGTDHEQMITVDKLGGNIHLILIGQAIEGSKAPYILAYSNESAAREAIDSNRGKFQGDYLEWDKAVARILEALEVEQTELEPSEAMGD